MTIFIPVWSTRLKVTWKSQNAIIDFKTTQLHWSLFLSIFLFSRSLTFIIEPSLCYAFSFNLKSIEHVFLIKSKLNNQEKQLENKLKNFVIFYLPRVWQV